MRTAVGQPALSAGAGRLGSALKLKAQAKSAGRFTSFVGFRFGAPWAEILGLELRVETVVGWETVICRQAKTLLCKILPCKLSRAHMDNSSSICSFQGYLISKYWLRHSRSRNVA